MGLSLIAKVNKLIKADALVNMVGLAIAALPSVLAIPILSRLFTPDEFGVFGSALAIAMIVSVFLSGRYETAIVVPESDRTAISVAAAAFSIATVSAGLSFILALLVSNALEVASPLIVVAAVLVAYLASVAQIAVNAAVRFGAFKALAGARILSALMQVGLSIAAGFLGFGAAGLLHAIALSYLVTIFMVGLSLGRHHFQWLDWAEVVGAAKLFRRYPLLNVPSEIANAVASQLPVLFFSAAFGASATGFLTMFNRAWAGSAILSRGLGEFFRNRAAKEMHALGNFRAAFRATAAPLAGLAVIVAVVLMAIGPQFFTFVLGTEWATTGVFAQILAPYVAVQLVSSTMSSAFYVSGNLKPMVFWQFSLLIVQFVVLWVATSYSDPLTALGVFSTSGAIMYTIYFVLSWRSAISPRSFPE